MRWIVALNNVLVQVATWWEAAPLLCIQYQSGQARDNHAFLRRQAKVCILLYSSDNSSIFSTFISHKMFFLVGNYWSSYLFWLLQSSVQTWKKRQFKQLCTFNDILTGVIPRKLLTNAHINFHQFFYRYSLVIHLCHLMPCTGIKRRLLLHRILNIHPKITWTVGGGSDKNA